MKKKYIFITLGIVSVVLIIIGIIFLNREPKKIEPIEDNTEEETNVIDLESYMGKLYTTLFEYANEIYDKKGYVNYPKRHNMYFISLNDLKKDYNYDISMFKGPDGKVCDVNESGISYDIDNYMHANYNDTYRPIFTELLGCTDDDTSLESSK